MQTGAESRKLTNAQLKRDLIDRGIAAPNGAKHADLVALWLETQRPGTKPSSPRSSGRKASSPRQRRAEEGGKIQLERSRSPYRGQFVNDTLATATEGGATKIERDRSPYQQKYDYETTDFLRTNLGARGKQARGLAVAVAVVLCVVFAVLVNSTP
jgi:hypothetical protein